MAKVQIAPGLSDFRNFLFLVWSHLGLPDPTRRQYAIASYLQHGPKRRMVEAFRGVGKSWITSAYVVWRLYNDPSLNIVVVSGSKSRADNFTTFCLRLINEIPELQHLMPRQEQRCSKIAFDVGPAGNSQTPSVVSMGITGTMTGNRADEVVADDIETPNNSATVAMREKLSELIKEFEALLKPGPNGRITFLGTPQTEDSVYEELPPRGYVIKIWPARYPDEKQQAKYGNNLAQDILEDLLKDPDLVGHSTEPTRFSDEDLAQRETSYGRAGFALQFMLDTDLSDMDRYPLKLQDLIVYPLDNEQGPQKLIWGALPELKIKDIPCVGMSGDGYYRPVPTGQMAYQKYQGVIMAIDPSGRGKDETGYAVVASLNGLLFVLDAGGFLGGYDPQTLTRLACIAQKWGVNKIIIEANFGDGMFTALIKPYLVKTHPCAVEEVKHSTQKEKRIIDTLEPVVSGHRLIINQTVIVQDFHSVDSYPVGEDGQSSKRYRLFHQFTRITRDKGALLNDDRLDSLAIAVNYWTQQMARDVDKAVNQEQARLLDQEIRSFKRHVLGNKSQVKPRQWVTFNTPE